MAAEYADLRVWLDAPLDVRADRIADRENKPLEEVLEETRARAASEAQRYREYYGIDIEDRSIYDLTVNTARWEADACLSFVLSAAESYSPDHDEGTYPVEGVRYEF
jgi:cytidylate kinase